MKVFDRYTRSREVVWLTSEMIRGINLLDRKLKITSEMIRGSFLLVKKLKIIVFIFLAKM